MDNFVQNISISDIIPSNYQPSKEEKRKIEELAILIKQFGLLDPILVRPKDGKYEIVMGMDKYQAALMANQTKVPVIIKEVDDAIYSKYSNIDNKQDISLNTLPTETFSKKEKNSDIINLSELSKIKLEYERNDLKMNNGQFNNDMTNNNLNFNQQNMNQPIQEPTFGGRFFPSLEDEPTNMNMMAGLNVQPNIPVEPTQNNNLIDLTDLSIEKEPVSMAQPDFGIPQMNIPPLEPSQGFNQPEPQVNEFSMPPLEPTPMPTNDNIINLESLQNNNPAVKPMEEPVPMEILNADFGAPKPMPNQFNIGQNIDFNIPTTPEFNEPKNTVQPDLGINNQFPPMTNYQPMPSFDMNPMETVPNNFNDIAPTPIVETPTEPLKDVTPVINTIKNLANSLAAFGYKLNITEEDLSNTSKIIIEVEK